MKRLSPCYIPVVNEDGKNTREKIEGERKKEIVQESANMGNVEIDNATSSSSDPSRDKRKSKHYPTSSTEKKLNPFYNSQPDNCNNPEPSCSRFQALQNEDQESQIQESNEESQQSSKLRKQQIYRNKLARLVAIDDSNHATPTQAEISRRLIEFCNTSYSSRNQNEDDEAENGMDETIEGIIIKNLIDLNEFNLKTGSESDSSTSETSVSTTTTVISITNEPDLTRSNSEKFEQLTVVENQVAAVEKDKHLVERIQSTTIRQNSSPQKEVINELGSHRSENKD